MFRARLSAAFAGADLRVVTAFWLFGNLTCVLLTWNILADPAPGLINNVLYVIILSAALDLVGPNVPKAVVLLADIVPSLVIKLCAPYFIHVIPYSFRIILFAVISSWGMLLLALAPPYTDGGTITTKMAGVILASLSSGAGELSFLGLTHYYGTFSQAAWGSGTGAAGLIGAGYYSITTTSIGLSVKVSLLASSCLPLIMILSFFCVLPRRPLQRVTPRKQHNGIAGNDEGDDDVFEREDRGLLADPLEGSTTSTKSSKSISWKTKFLHDLRRSRGLIIP
jgi:battenin